MFAWSADRPTGRLRATALACAGLAGLWAIAPASRAEVPSGGPPALYAPEPALPAPAGWPFGEAFPRTSGAGRVAGGAFFWTDFLYDDQGAIGAGPPANESSGAPSFGTYKYPEPDAAANGADLFRVAVGLDATDTWWRVDWNTLIDPALPLAAFGIDADGDVLTGSSDWPAGAALMSPGLEWVLVLSAAGAWLHDVVTLPAPPPIDVTAAGGAVFVDTSARSFVVRLPRSSFEPSGVSTLYAVAGLADAEGDGFLPLDAAHGALPGGTNVYNATFRDYADEPPGPWMDQTQAIDLITGDASAFSAELDWARLAAAETDPEPIVTGYVNRWYVSSIEPGQGITTVDPLGNHYLGRVQPYLAFVPSSYTPGVPAPVTFWLHGASANHNSQASQNPNTLLLMCEDRGSICLSTLGRGPLGNDGGYGGDAELDYWEVWRGVADDFDVDPDRTIQSGYSMGGFGSYDFTENYPDLYAGVVIMSATDIGPPDPFADGRQLENLKWTPYYHTHGGADQLVPVTGAELTVQALDGFGYRHRFDLYPAEDHVAYSIKDEFEAAAEFMAEQGVRKTDPGHIVYRWLPSRVDPLGRFGPTGAWWVDEAVARDPATDDARVEALSRARPEPEVTLVRTTEALPEAQPSPAVRTELAWTPGAAPPAEKLLTLDLDNVGSVTLDLVGAGLVPGGGSVGDWDGDGVPDAGDNCPYLPNPAQSDVGGLASDPPDGVGDVCQCGDVTDNGKVNGQDANAIRRHGLDLEPNPAFRVPCKCEVTGNGVCNGQDGGMIKREIFGLPGLYDPTACAAFTGERRIEVDSDGASSLVLAGLVAGTSGELDGVPAGVAGGDGRLTIAVPAGLHVITLRP